MMNKIRADMAAQLEWIREMDANGELASIPGVCGEFPLKPLRVVDTSLDSGTAIGNYRDPPPCDPGHGLSTPG